MTKLTNVYTDVSNWEETMTIWTDTEEEDGLWLTVLSACSMTLGKSLIFQDCHSSLSCEEAAQMISATVKTHGAKGTRLESGFFQLLFLGAQEVM